MTEPGPAPSNLCRGGRHPYCQGYVQHPGTGRPVRCPCPCHWDDGLISGTGETHD